jgi:exopolysaccharide biosynthesis operon protein EpsL
MTRIFRPVLYLASICLLPAAAQAQLLGPFTVHVGAGLEHDSNVLRTPSDQERSDQVGSLSIGLKGDKQYGLQRFRLEAEATRYRYQNLSELNYSTVNYAAAWDFQVTPRFQGVLSANRTQYRDVSRFTDVTGIERAGGTGGRSDRAEVLEGRYLIDGPWRVLGGVLHNSSTSRDARRDINTPYDASPSVRSARVGVAYEFASGTEFTARVRRGNGEYTDLPQSSGGSIDFRETETDFGVKWPVTAKTTVNGRIAYFQRNHSGNSALDFSGPVGEGSVSYEVTAKTRLTGGVSTALDSYQLGAPGHIRSTRVYVRPVYKPTVKTEVSLHYVHETRDFSGAPAGSTEDGRRDTSQWITAGFGYQPLRNVELAATLRYERRNSNVPFGTYRDMTAGGTVSVGF